MVVWSLVPSCTHGFESTKLLVGVFSRSIHQSTCVTLMVVAFSSWMEEEEEQVVDGVP